MKWEDKLIMVFGVISLFVVILILISMFRPLVP